MKNDFFNDCSDYFLQNMQNGVDENRSKKMLEQIIKELKKRQAETATKENWLEINCHFYLNHFYDSILSTKKESSLSSKNRKIVKHEVDLFFEVIEKINNKMPPDFIFKIFQSSMQMDHDNFNNVIERIEQHWGGINQVFSLLNEQEQTINKVPFMQCFVNNHIDSSISLYDSFPKEFKKLIKPISFMVQTGKQGEIRLDKIEKLKKIFNEFKDYQNFANNSPIEIHGKNFYGDFKKNISGLESFLINAKGNTYNVIALEHILQKPIQTSDLPKKITQSSKKPLIHYLIQKKDFVLTKMMLETHPEWIDYISYNGKNLLHLAGNVDAIKYLIEKGVDPYKRDKYGILPVIQILATGIFDKQESLRNWAINFIKTNKIGLDEKYFNQNLADLLQTRKPLFVQFKKIIQQQNKKILAHHYLSNLKLHFNEVENLLPTINASNINLLDDDGKNTAHIIWNNKQCGEKFYHYKSYIFKKMLENNIDINKMTTYYNENHQKIERNPFNLWFLYKHCFYKNTKSRYENGKNLKFEKISIFELSKQIFCMYDWNKMAGWDINHSKQAARLIFFNSSDLINKQEIEKAFLPYLKKLTPKIYGEILYFAMKDFYKPKEELLDKFPELVDKAIITPELKKRIILSKNANKMYVSDNIQWLYQTLQKNTLKNQATAVKNIKNKIML